MRQIEFFILPLLLEAWRIHFRSTLNSAHNKIKYVLEIIFYFTWKWDYPASFIQFGISPTLFPLQILSIHFLCHSFEYILFQQIWHYHETKRVMWENLKKAKLVNKSSIVLHSMWNIVCFVKYTQWNWFYIASTENPLINPIVHWGNIFRGKKCFLDYADSSSIGSRDKFFYAATAKTSPGNLLSYLIRTCFTSGWVSVLFHCSFFEKYS